ncbi:MAG TPA: PAS domain S-box protein [Thermoanaerobaculia bacterium]|nr:PAS domain S-box protein [Thermoanaerobaculia bacterium]
MALRHDLKMPAAEIAVLIDAIEDYAIFLLGPQGEIRSWNSGAARIMGYEAEEAVGSNFMRFYGPEDLAARKPQTELEIATREGRVYDEGWRVRKDGTRFWANTVITAMRDNTGRLTGFAKITRDLTERRAAEERLRRSEEMFRLLVASVREYAIFLLDPDGNILTWNAGAERIKGYKPEEIIGRHFSSFYAKEDLWKPERELEIARRDGSVEDEGWRLRKDGTRFWANVVITAVHDEHGELRGFTKVTRDMTERRRAEEALFEQREARFMAEEERRRAEASYRVAQEANRAKDEFLMTLSHELRTPMTAILGWARLLPALPPNEESFKEAVAAIGRSAQLQSRLIDDVLDVSRIVSGKLRLTVENVDLVHLLEATIDTVRPSADAKAITITTSFAAQLGSVVADATRLQQILWNLMTNAVKFTPRHGEVRIAARRTSSHVQVAVTDSGEGIDPGFLPHVFEPFRQAENPSTRVHGGLGLGLSIVRYLAEAHGGTVTAESKGKGLGATFTVTIPITGAVSQPESKHEAATPVSTADIKDQLTGRFIVLVDDDEEGRRVFRMMLRQAGAEVLDVSTAAMALDAIAARKPDVVITDIAMPGTDGYTLARRLREENADLKIVALTAFPAGRNAAKDSVFDAYVTKPVEPGDLVEAIARV